MVMTRVSTDLTFQIVLPGNPQASALPTPMLLQQVTLYGDDGKQLGQPIVQQLATTPDDYSDGFIDSLNSALAIVGLQISRAG